MLGAAYIYSRSLWLPIAIHFAWNFMQTGIFGAVTSGNDNTPGLLTKQLTGTEWLPGGGFRARRYGPGDGLLPDRHRYFHVFKH